MRKAKQGSSTSRLTMKRRRNAPWCEACRWAPPRPIPWTILNVHHLVPRAAGGGDEPDNVIILCPNCHAMAHALHRTRPASSKEELISVLLVLHRTNFDGTPKDIEGTQGAENRHTEGV